MTIPKTVDAPSPASPEGSPCANGMTLEVAFDKFQQIRDFLAESPLHVVDAQTIGDIIDGPRKIFGDTSLVDVEEAV